MGRPRVFPQNVKLFSYMFRPPLGLYNRAQIIMDRRRRAGQKNISVNQLLIQLLTDWVYREEHAWQELPQAHQDPPAELW